MAGFGGQRGNRHHDALRQPVRQVHVLVISLVEFVRLRRQFRVVFVQLFRHVQRGIVPVGIHVAYGGAVGRDRLVPLGAFVAQRAVGEIPGKQERHVFRFAGFQRHL